MRRIARDRRGSVLVIFSFGLIFLIFALGMGIDYARAMRTQAKLAALADAAALASVSKSGMELTPEAAERAAFKLFVSQAMALRAHGLLMNFNDERQLRITVAESSDASVARRARVEFDAESQNIFARILGMRTLHVRGLSSTSTMLAPNVDVYVLLDTSPSMLLPATSQGVAEMVAATNGCAFACHETRKLDSNYAIARQRNIVLRTDVMSAAVQRLATMVKEFGQVNGARYRMGIHDFDYIFRTIWPASRNHDGSWVDHDLDRVSAHVADAKVLAYCGNSERVCGIYDMDTATDFTAAFRGINSIIPSPGKGSARPGDKPQAILFVITDGMRDEYTEDHERVMGPIPSALCDAIKARDIRIAMLNTKYLPESASDEWSIANVRTPLLSPVDKLTPALTACASPGLYHEVTMDDDLSASLSQLFQKAVQTASIDR
ncbi:MAG: pilus assembly protein TadG-related protein [Sphingomonas paucimobilis]